MIVDPLTALLTAYFMCGAVTLLACVPNLLMSMSIEPVPKPVWFSVAVLVVLGVALWPMLLVRR